MSQLASDSSAVLFTLRADWRADLTVMVGADS